MEITNELIQKLANLSKLKYESAEEIATIKNDLQSMLNFVEQIDEIDTQTVAPLIHICEEVNVFRKDEVIELNKRADALLNATDNDGVYIKVPKVIEK